MCNDCEFLLKVMKKDTQDNHNDVGWRSFGVLDIARVFSGLLVANAILSWFFTSSSTWGYDGKWINPSYLSFKVRNNFVKLTLDELAKYDGQDKALPLYLAINGSVYDVSVSRTIYGPGGPYSKFAGKDAARAWVTGCFGKPDEFTYDLREIDEKEARNAIQNWQDFYDNHRKYWYVGTVIHEEITGPPPEPCEHVAYPGS